MRSLVEAERDPSDARKDGAPVRESAVFRCAARVEEAPVEDAPMEEAPSAPEGARPAARESMVVRAARAEDEAEPSPALEFDSLTIEREVGAQPRNDAFVDRVHALTLRIAGVPIPFEETQTRLARANLGHYIFIERGGLRDLIGYSLNEIFRIDLCASTVRVNYFCSAFLLPETRNLFSLYSVLGAMRVSGREEIVLMRTQNPLVMTSFFRLCRRHGYRAFSAASTNIPPVAREVLVARFGHDDFVHRRVYPGRVSPVEMARTTTTCRLMSLIDPDAGDSCVFCGVLRETRAGGPYRREVRLRRGVAA